MVYAGRRDSVCGEPELTRTFDRLIKSSGNPCLVASAFTRSHWPRMVPRSWPPS